MKNGFTLAEVLITLGIIGVVAALTMTTLIQNYKTKVTVTKLKKNNSVLSQAYLMYLKDNEPSTFTTDEAGAVEAANVFKPYLKIANDCGTQTLGCVADDYSSKDSSGGIAHYDSMSVYYKMILADGSNIWLKTGNGASYDIDIFYDINGKSGPNKWGYDLFEFIVYGKTLYPHGLPNQKVSDFDTACGPTNTKGFACAAWVIYKENLDYLHCGDLTWNGKQKCD